MTKNQLLEAWREEAEKHYSNSLGLARHESLLDCLCQAIAVALAQGDDVPLPHIGKLKVRNKAARTGRNPWTGAPVEIPAKRKAVLVAGKELKEALNS